MRRAVQSGYRAVLATFLAAVLSFAAALPVGELSPTRYASDVRFLSSADLKGRGNGTPELEKAADYIAAQFREAGLRPAGDNGTFFQKFEMTTGVTIGKNSALVINDATVGQDKFATIPFSMRGRHDGVVVFAGYGITAPELQWDDYAGINVQGKAVVVFRHQPEEGNPSSRFANTPHATFVNKAINASRHGARAIIFVTDPNNHAGEADDVGRPTRDLDGTDLNILALHASREAVAPLFERSGRTIEEVQKTMDAAGKPQSFEFAKSNVRVVADLERTRKTVRNVVASIQGTDEQLRREWVVLGAHYDHLGLGDRNSLSPSSIGQAHLGADDNASGTAGLMELGRLIARHRAAFKRSVLFIAFAGEELGLFGSQHFVERPTISGPIVGMVNMDMIGRVRNGRLDVMGTGTSPDFKAWVEEASQGLDLKLNLSDGGHEGSDHISFNSKRIPILFFFSGLHEDYHRPSDTFDKINAAGAIQVLSIVARVAEQMGNVAMRPQYTEVRRPEPQGAPGGGGGGYGPYFGSVPDFRDDLNGVLFADVRSDSPAAKAGLKAGDLLVEFGGQPVRNLQEFTYALSVRKPGDTVVVAVRRENQTLRVNVTLEARR